MLEQHQLAAEGEVQGREATSVVLRALDSLLGLDGGHGAFAAMFQSLDPLFAHDRAMVLESSNDALLCLAADPPDLTGRSWIGSFLSQVVNGRVLASHRGADLAAWKGVPADLLPPGQPALAFPISVDDRPAILLLLREEGRDNFGDDHIAMARHAAVVALAGSAERSGNRLEAEIHRLNLLVAELRDGERRAQEDYHLLREIVDRLPCGVTVRDDRGQPVLVNAVAAANTPLDGEAAIDSRAPEIAESQGDDVNVSEATITSESGQRTWLTSHKRARILDRSLLLSSSTDITERKAIEAEWSRRAYFDDLTGLSNRLFMQEHLESEIRRIGNGGRFALAFIDIDNFKHVNDYYSHAVGDVLLTKVAARIAERLRATDILARVNGDEFLLLLDPIEGADQAQDIIEQILADIKRPFHIDAYEIFTSASIGVSLYPEHGQSYEALRRNADNAMYRVKSGSKGAALLFNAEMGRSITARMENEQQLRLAIRDNRFCCAFQPKVDIYSKQVVGFESLVRWRDENGESRSPGTFISLAMELGLIDVITHFILEETLRSIERLDESFGGGTTFSVNVPSLLAGDPGFMQSLAETLRSSGCAQRILLELTEDAFVATNPFQQQVLPMLREIGVRISVDDFGTGYSSLAALADVTADELKVDRSFITEIHLRPRNQSILKSIESLGQALGMTIIAEGVETIQELAYLQEATRIRYAQGYYFCKPFFLTDSRSVKSGNRGSGINRERLDSNRVRETRARAS